MTKLRAAVLGLVTLAAVSVPGVALAQTNDTYASTNTTQVTVEGTVISNSSTPPPAQPVAVLGESQSRAASSSLPFTGGDVAGLAIVGLVLVGAGVVLVRRNRTSSSH